MSKIFEKINIALNNALKNKDAERVLTLRSIVSQKKDREIELRTSDQKEVSDIDVVNILLKMTKQRKESMDMYEKGGRADLVNKEKLEIKIIEEFLPQQMNDEEIGKSCKEVSEETGAQSIKDMGKVMKILRDKHIGTMDFAKAGKFLKEYLQK